MRALHGRWYQRDGYAICPFDPSVTHANILTLALEQGRFAAEEVPFDWSNNTDMFVNSAKDRQGWFESCFAATMPTDEQRATLSALNVMTSRFFGSPGAAEALSSITRMFLMSMLRPRATRSDVGRCVMGELVNHSDKTGISRKWGILPATGYPRPVLTCETKFLSMKEAFYAPHPKSEAVQQIALTLMRLDAFRPTFRMFQPPDVIDGIERKTEKMFGMTKVVQHVLDDMFAYFNLYRISAMRLLYAFNDRIRRLAISLYKQRAGTRHADLVMIAETAHDDFMRLPVHPLVKYYESCFSTGAVLSEYGKHDAVWAPVNLAAQPSLVADYLSERPAVVCGVDNYSMMAKILEDYLVEVSTQVVGGECMARAWGWSGTSGPLITPISFMASIRADREIEARFPKMAAGLGWGSLTGDLGEIDQLAVQFAVTDGIHMSHPPDQVACGLRPLLSLGNEKAFGLTYRHDESFKPMTQSLNAFPIRGRVDVTDSREHFERRYLPYSMTMREPGLVFLSTLNIVHGMDRVTDAMLLHYKSRAAQYISPFYSAIKVPAGTASSRIFQSAWDPFGQSAPDDSDEAVLLGNWQSAIELSGQSAPADTIPFAERSNGELFYGRVLTRNAIMDGIVLLERQGLYAMTSEPSRFVIYDNSFELPYDAAAMEKLMALLPPVGAVSPIDVTVEDLKQAVKEPV